MIEKRRRYKHNKKARKLEGSQNPLSSIQVTLFPYCGGRLDMEKQRNPNHEPSMLACYVHVCMRKLVSSLSTLKTTVQILLSLMLTPWTLIPTGFTSLGAPPLPFGDRLAFKGVAACILTGAAECKLV